MSMHASQQQQPPLSNGATAKAMPPPSPQQLQQQQLLLSQQHYVLPPFPSSPQSLMQQQQQQQQSGKPIWTPDPSISHLLHLMDKFGPKSNKSGKNGLKMPEGFDEEEEEEEEQHDFLQQLLQSRELNSVLKMYNVILFANQEQCPCVSNCCQIAAEVMEDVRPYALMIEECRELYAILTTPHIRSLLASHDIVAQRDYLPKLGEIPLEVDEDEETVKIVQLVKSQDPMGATIKTEDGTGRIVIARVMHGGAADRSGLISVGDEVLEVNGIAVEGKSPNDVLKILQSAENTITFKLIPCETRLSSGTALMTISSTPSSVTGGRESKVRLRALFDYDPRRDPNIPCQDAGLAFYRGDILHIVSQEDPFWWQARREHDRTMRAGLIPSRQLQERRMLNQRDEMAKKQMREWNEANPDCLFTCGMAGAMRSYADGQPYAPATNAATKTVVPLITDPITAELKSPESCAEDACLVKAGGQGKGKARKVMYTVADSDDFDREEVFTYECVARLFPRAGVFRPVVLVGPPGVGRNEVKRRFVAMDQDRFRITIPHTTRPPRPGEVHGRDYFFCDSKPQMAAEIAAGRFVEHGEFRGNLYGTSIDGVKQLVEAGLQPVLTPHIQALKKLRTLELKPFIIYIKPPPFDRLVETRTRAKARSTFVENGSRAFTDEEFHAMLRAGERMEFWHGHNFDLTVTNDDLESCFADAARAVHRLDQDAQWVPESWVQ